MGEMGLDWVWSEMLLGSISTLIQIRCIWQNRFVMPLSENLYQSHTLTFDLLLLPTRAGGDVNLDGTVQSLLLGQLRLVRCL